jgi:hypothetical protein
MKDGEDTLAFLLRLNLELADLESKWKAITPPGLPAHAAQRSDFVTTATSAFLRKVFNRHEAASGN